MSVTLYDPEPEWSYGFFAMRTRLNSGLEGKGNWVSTAGSCISALAMKASHREVNPARAKQTTNSLYARA